MKGKILFCSTLDVFEQNLDEYQVKLQITRYTKKGILSGFIHAPGLSPNQDLLNTTNNKWKKLIFTDVEKQKMAKGKAGTWWDLYCEQFYLQMEMDITFILNYQRLKEHLDNGNNIIACCYCKEPDKCHRSLIANSLKNEGYNVTLI